MKNITAIIIAAFSLILMSCSTQSIADKAQLQSLLAKNQFTFMAERANPTNYDVINVMNSIPNSTASRMLDLDYGYTVQLKDKEISVELPYFGRMYNSNYDTSKNALRFTSKNYKINKTVNKKGTSVYEIALHDAKQIRTLYIEVFKNGKAMVSVNADDRQPISYSGYITENKEVKK